MRADNPRNEESGGDRPVMGTRKAPTLRDVAARAGLSPATVSAVLNDCRSNTRVSEKTRQRIVDSAAELRYHPNALARSFRSRTTNVFGFYSGYGTNDVGFPFHADVMRGIQFGCEVHRKDLLIHGAYRGQATEDIYAEVAGGKIDGLILIAPPTDSLVEKLAASHLPVVSLAESLPSLVSVVVDDEAGGRLQAETVAARGHTKVWYRLTPLPTPSAEIRRVSFLAAAQEAGLDVREVEDDGSFTEVLGRAGAARPSIIACWNDVSAWEAMRACHELGLSIPQDIAIIGYDGCVPSVGPMQRLTTIQCGWQKCAHTATDLLADLIQEGRINPAHLPADAVLREEAGRTEVRLPVVLSIGDTA